MKPITEISRSEFEEEVVPKSEENSRSIEEAEQNEMLEPIVEEKLSKDEAITLKLESETEEKSSEYVENQYSFGNSSTRKNRKKTEREERKKRKREEILKYFSENKFDLVREVNSQENEDRKIESEEAEKQNVLIAESLSEEINKEATIEVSNVYNSGLSAKSLDDEEVVDNTDEEQNETWEEDEANNEISELSESPTLDTAKIEIETQILREEAQRKEDILSEKESSFTESVVIEMSDTPKLQQENIDYTFTSIRRKRNRLWWFILIPTFLAIAVLGVWYYLPVIKSYLSPYLPTKKEQVQIPPKAVAAPVDVVKPTVTSDTLTQSTSDESLAEKDVFAVKREYKEFVGSEVMKPGIQLSLLAKRYLNHRYFWVYIYEANKDVIKDPNNIAVGTVIRIPKVDPYLIDVNNPECFKYAERLANEYLSKNKK
ncbi:MAG: hypothetical protein QM751_15255 [Paludibacteraceae bacterium]